MLALYQRDQQGGADGNGSGQMIDLALYEPTFRLTGDMMTQFMQSGAVRERIGNRNPTFAPAGTFETKDGRYIQIAAGGDKVFERLTHAMGQPELSKDPRYAKSINRIARADELEGLLAAWIKERDFRDIEERMIGSNVPFGGIYTAADIANDPHYAARDNIAYIDDPELGEVAMPAVIPKMSATPGRIEHVGPHLGAYNTIVLQELLGKSPEEISALQADGVV
jgi:crotonobetainyl-CoA:carnitine CoA-transferase CaiB-like acyl-CoA transferase